MITTSPSSEQKRLAALHSLRILNSGDEPLFDNVTLLASSILRMPMALITFVDHERVWFKSHPGMNQTDASRPSWFCDYAMQSPDILIVKNAVEDNRFKNHPFVSSAPKIRFYAGIPLILKTGEALGTLCVLDKEVRELSREQCEVLQTLGRQLTAILEFKRSLAGVAAELEVNKRLAESANTVKDAILANMSHEIRTPIAAILGMSDFLLNTELKESQREYVSTIRSSGESLLGIMDDILDVSKMESGNLELSLQPLDLRACVEKTIESNSLKAIERGNEIVCDIATDVPQQIVGDVERLHRVLGNLIANANKFTQNGEIELSIRSHKRAENKCDVTFSVNDTGIGIPKEKLEMIFEAFGQADSSVSRKYGGAGMGLTVGSRLVHLMGGTMQVKSAVGKGSSFSFTIPAVFPSDKSISSASTVSPELNRKKVLIVDDNPKSLRVLAEECSRLGMIPVSVASAGQALDLLKKNEVYDMAIYDNQLSEGDGIQLAADTKELQKSSSMPIILLSSRSLEDSRIKDNQDLFAATVMKPPKFSQLEALMVDVVTKKATRTDSTSIKDASKLQLGSEIPISIMVAEDNFINQKIVQRMLRSMGYEPVIVESGLEVLEVFEKTPFDLIFMDVQMPEMDGLEATRKLRLRYGENEKPVIVAMTAFALAGDREKCLNAGMNDYLSKPFVSDQVASIIRQWCGRKPTADDGRRVMEETLNDSVDVDIQARLRELETETERSFVKELIRIYLDEVPENLQNLKKAVHSRDGRSIEQIAHKLKGGSMNLGAQKLSLLFETVEQIAARDVSAISDSHITAIDREFVKTVNYLQSYLAIP